MLVASFFSGFLAFYFIKMTIISDIESIKEKISSKISYNENLSKFSWFNLGGPAKVLFRPKNLKELSVFLKAAKELGNIKVLGAGSNTLIRDGGFDGIIIKFGKPFSHLSLFNSNTIIAGASALDKNAEIKILEIIQCLKDRIIIIISHDLNLKKVCDKFIEL